MSTPRSRGPVVVVTNLKGGTGKTTLATTIAEELHAWRRTISRPHHGQLHFSIDLGLLV